MKKFLLIALALFLILVFGVLLFAVFDSTPAGWTKHKNNLVGFQIIHPQEAAVRFNEGDYRALGGEVFFLFTIASHTNAEEEIFSDGLWLSVNRFPLQSKTLEQIAREGRQTAITHAYDETVEIPEVQSIVFVNQQGYSYQIPPSYDPLVHVMLIPASETDYFEISYAFADPTNQGYEQTIQQMLSSFAVTKTGGVSPVAIMLGIGIAVALVLGFGLLFIMRRS